MLDIKVLGSCCSNCNNLEQLCKEVVAENSIDAIIEKISDYKDIMSYGIISLPGLVVNGKVLSSGKLPTKPVLTQWFMNILAEIN